jgi:hypothetical protein
LQLLVILRRTRKRRRRAHGLELRHRGRADQRTAIRTAGGHGPRLRNASRATGSRSVPLAPFLTSFTTRSPVRKPSEDSRALRYCGWPLQLRPPGLQSARSSCSTASSPWLSWNSRVLALAADATLPLLERTRFCSIFSRNLDEFFMVRVAGLLDQVDAGVAVTSPDARTPQQALGDIRERVLELSARQSKLWNVSSASRSRSPGSSSVRSRIARNRSSRS